MTGGVNIKRNLIYVIISILLIGSAVLFLSFKSRDSISSLPKIKYNNVLNQEEKEYLVYFWQKDCKACEFISPSIVNYSKENNIPLYIVDMKKDHNSNAWYDWESHHNKYDKKIGKEVNGNTVMNDGENLEYYESDSGVDWKVIVNSEYEIIATHNTPYVNKSPKTVSEIMIAATPTLVVIKNEEIDSYFLGITEIQAFLGRNS